MSKQGIVAAYILDGRGGGEAIDWDQVNSWQPAQGILWLHLDYTDQVSRRWLEQESGLQEVIVSALLNEEPRPRSTTILDGLLLTMRGVNLNPGADPEDMVSIRLWVTENKIISTRHRKLLSISDMREAIDTGFGPESAGEFVVQLSGRLVERMSDSVSAIDDKIDQYEDVLLTENSRLLRKDISSLRRETIRMRRYLAPQRDAMNKLCIEKISWLSDVDRIELREITDNTIRYIEDLDAVREKAIVVQEELMNAMSEQMEKRMYMLSIVAAIFLPLGFFTGLLGVNLAGIPGAENKISFSVFVVLLTGIVALQIYLFKKLKWM